MTVAATAVGERNLAALARHQPELAERLRACLDDVDVQSPAPSEAVKAEWWGAVLARSGPVLLYGAGGLRDLPPDGRSGPALLILIERRPQPLVRALRSVEMAAALQMGRLALVLAEHELELVEALKPFLPVLLRSAPPATIIFFPGLPIEEAEQYRRWGEEAGRFIEFSRDPAVLNIELYQRFKPVADRINALAGSDLTVLDAGGREWTFSAFLPTHRVVVADLETTGIDARALPYTDGSFDVVTAHHLLEHIADPERMRAMTELVRVARKRVFVTGPFDENPFAREIDHLLAGLEPDNPYLQEHVRLGLPSLKEIENWLSAKGLVYRVEPLTRCNTWLLALALTPFQHTRPHDFREVTRYYNRRFSDPDRGHPAYQTLVEIEVD